MKKSELDKLFETLREQDEELEKFFVEREAIRKKCDVSTILRSHGLEVKKNGNMWCVSKSVANNCQEEEEE